MVTLSAPPASNSSPVTYCLEWRLVCQTVFLHVLTPPSTLRVLCALAPESLSILLPLLRSKLLLIYLLARERCFIILTQSQALQP